jgi:hypothetical protein
MSGKTVSDTKEIRFKRAKKMHLDTESRKMDLEIRLIELRQNVIALEGEISSLERSLEQHASNLAAIQNGN